MEVLMILLVGFGLAFDIFAIAVDQGTVLGDVKARNMVLMCLIVCAWQLAALGVGYAIGLLPNIEGAGQETRTAWTAFAGTILIGLGGIKIFLIQKKKAVPEVRSEMDFKRICGIAASTSIYTCFAGIAGSFIGLSRIVTGITICCMTVGLVILGVYVGYRNGEVNHKVYWAGGILLICAGILTILRDGLLQF